jgi:hypothetical protein
LIGGGSDTAVARYEKTSIVSGWSIAELNPFFVRRAHLAPLKLQTAELVGQRPCCLGHDLFMSFHIPGKREVDERNEGDGSAYY